VESARTLLDTDRPTASAAVEEAIALLYDVGRSNSYAPRDIAASHLNRGMAYMFRISGNSKENFERGLADYQEALLLFRRARDVLGECTATIGVGGALYELGRWNEAQCAFLRAIALVGDEWRECNTAQARLALARRHGKMFGLAVASAIKAEEPRFALAILEQGRARLLRNTLDSCNPARPSRLPAKAWQQLLECRRRRHEWAKQLAGGNHPDQGALIRLLENAEDDRQSEVRILQRIRIRRPALVEELPNVTFQQVESLSRRLKAQLWFLKPTGKGTAFIVVDPARGTRSHPLPAADHKLLSKLLLGTGGWFRTYSTIEIWTRRMHAVLSDLSDLILGPCLEFSKLLTETTPRPSTAERPPYTFWLEASWGCSRSMRFHPE